MSFTTTSLDLNLFFATTIAAVAALVAKYLLPAWAHGRLTPEFRLDTTTTIRALPSSWYRSEEVYELERRAIFSKKWILVTHKLKFTENGSWVRFEEAGLQFFLVRNNNGKINGFHNICRHRAFPVVTQEEGKSSVLSCKYHGWSYGLNGQLAKAPGYNGMGGFDKAKNGLFLIHVHVDAKGFIWEWSAEFGNIDQLARHDPFNFEDYHFDHTWGMSGDYNWKTLADNYNEFYHCKTAHPDSASIADLQAYKVDPKGGNIEHFANTSAKQEDEGPDHREQLLLPQRLHGSLYEVYRHKNASDEDFKKIDEMFKRILTEDKWLCNNAQKNLNAGVFINGEMHPKLEHGPLYFQHRVRELLNRHHQLERAAKKEISPAQQILPGGSGGTDQDMSLCSGLACGKDQGALAW
ncbi:hypothetical protein QQX98_006967 [Neonectria punicea]|uniref:Choline monooxygenase, chloroplastic n=1 Tax=Neonectria punicea TaxID=979145 RepID=A0ABR1H0M9_9HYPO